MGRGTSISTTRSPSTPRRSGAPTDDGQAVLAAVLLVGVLVVCALVVGRVAHAAVARAGAQAAADAVALAGAAEGRAAADRVAAANDAAIERYDVEGPKIVVAVRRRGVTATAAAEALGSARRPHAAIADRMGDRAHAGPSREGPA